MRVAAPRRGGLWSPAMAQHNESQDLPYRPCVGITLIGPDGGVFVGPELTPAREQLLLNTCNWLLGRDDLLPRAEPIWQYPRIHLDARTEALWHWGTWLVLPGVFAYLGLVVLMVRRLR